MFNKVSHIKGDSRLALIYLYGTVEIILLKRKNKFAGEVFDKFYLRVSQNRTIDGVSTRLIRDGRITNVDRKRVMASIRDRQKMKEVCTELVKKFKPHIVSLQKQEEWEV